MKLFKAFIAGLVLPSIVLPIVLLLAWWGGNQELTETFPLHFIPVIWGIWNVLYYAICREVLPGSENGRLLLTGGLLGLILAFFGVFVLGIPEMIGVPKSYQFYPIIAAPIVYALLWRYVVKEFNKMLDLEEEV